MNNEIRIHVASGSAQGKTTMAELLQEFLTYQGYNSTHIEMEPLREEYYSKERTRSRRSTVKEKAIIIIEERQMSRDGKIMGKLSCQ